MQKITFAKAILALCLTFASIQAKASISDGFLLEPFLTIEYSAPEMSSGGVNTYFKTKPLGSQLGNIENIVLGGHFRIHKFLGLNVNWAQSDLTNEEGLQDYSVSLKPRFKMDYFNFSIQTFIPIIEDSLFELFLEGGLSDMQTSLSIFETSGNYSKLKDHQTNPFFGGGLQIAPFEDSKDAFRISVLRYVDKISLLDTDFTTIRLGYIKRF